MIKNEYNELQNLILAECDVPENFFPKHEERKENCYLLFKYESCSFLFFDSCYESFTGYLPGEYQKGGLNFWFSKVHPDDRRMLGDRINESLKVSKNSFNKQQPDPTILNYRFKKGTGEWIWIQHTVYNLSIGPGGNVDKVLHRLHLLDVLAYPDNSGVEHYELLLNQQQNINKLTNRETQVLKLISEGFSTKMISDRLEISINTVETHRRRLLEKLEAKNSMELIKKSFRLFSN